MRRRPDETILPCLLCRKLGVVGRGRVVDVDWPPIDAAVETGDYVGDLSRADRVLGWRPTTPLKAGLVATWSTYVRG